MHVRRNKLISTTLFVIIGALSAFGQSNLDVFKVVKSDFKQGNYSQMLSHLYEIDQQFIGSSDFFKYKAIACDSLKKYSLAVDAYIEYYKLNPGDSTCNQRIEVLSQILEQRGKCKFCRGTCIVQELKRCEKCAGIDSVLVLCNFCKGTVSPNCTLCHGSGKMLLSSGKVGICSLCNGSGHFICKNCEGKRYIKVKCDACKDGYNKVSFKCTRHL